MAKKPVEFNVEGAAILMEQVFASGMYQTYKNAEHVAKKAKEQIRKSLPSPDEKYFNLNDLVIAKFIATNKYQVDQLGLNEFLMDSGLLPVVGKINPAIKKEDPEMWKILEPFQYWKQHFAKMTPNKAGRADLDENLDFSSFTLDSLGNIWMEHARKFKTLDKQMKKICKQMEKCPILKAKQKLSSHFGSVSRLEKDPRFNIQKIFEEFGPDFLIQNCKLDAEEMDRYIQRGIINPRDIEAFRKPVDVELKFVVMEEESEAKLRQFFYNKTMRAAQNRRKGDAPMEITSSLSEQYVYHCEYCDISFASSIVSPTINQPSLCSNGCGNEHLIDVGMATTEEEKQALIEFAQRTHRIDEDDENLNQTA